MTMAAQDIPFCDLDNLCVRHWCWWTVMAVGIREGGFVEWSRRSLCVTLCVLLAAEIDKEAVMSSIGGDPRWASHYSILRDPRGWRGGERMTAVSSCSPWKNRSTRTTPNVRPYSRTEGVVLPVLMCMNKDNSNKLTSPSSGLHINTTSFCDVKFKMYKKNEKKWNSFVVQNVLNVSLCCRSCIGWRVVQCPFFGLLIRLSLICASICSNVLNSVPVHVHHIERMYFAISCLEESNVYSYVTERR